MSERHADFHMLDGNTVYEALCHSSSNYIFMFNLSTGRIRVSPNMVEFFGLSGEIIEDFDRLWLPRIHPEDRMAVQRELLPIHTRTKTELLCDYRVQDKQGQYAWIRERGFCTVVHGICYFIGMLRNLRRETKIDPVTNLLSKYEMEKALDSFKQRSEQLRAGGVLLLGLDRFSKVNTMYSYSVGNRILHAVGEKLSAVCPKNVALYRADGDKFMMLSERWTEEDVKELFALAQRTLSCMELPDGENLSISVSGGAVMLCGNPMKDELHASAEYALDSSKEEGPGNLTFYSEQLLHHDLYYLELREVVRKCVRDHFEGFELYYQPINDGNTRELVSCEALLRWKHRDYSNVYPDTFVPILEDTGLIVEVGEWVVSQALEQLKVWRAACPNLHININVSYVQVCRSNICAHVKRELERLELPPECLVVELTESCEITDFACAKQFVQELNDAGVSVALDDFGTGYASLEVLKCVPVTWVKLDHNFVSKIANDAFDRNTIRYLTLLCHSNNMKVCAEGVEDARCYELMRKQNVETVQGYYFSKPIPQGDFEHKYISVGA